MFEWLQLLHMSVFSQSFSPCGRFLAAGNNYGEIAVFSLSAALSPDATAANQKPVLTFTAHEGPVFSLLSTDVHLLSAGNGEISAWSWNELSKKNVKPLWTKRPNYKSSLEIPEINSMIINPRDNSLVVGGGDNNIHILDLEHGVFKNVLQGHSDYIHCVSVRDREAEILSGGEDGAVRMWDSRSGQCVHCIEVYKYESCARPQFGKWISCLTTDSDWMLCGGGPSLSLWHLRSLSPTSVFPLSGCQRQAAFYQDKILAVGEGAFVSHCLLGGEVKAQIPCTPQSLNTLQLNTNSTEHRVLTVGGSSDHIDVFTNLSYRAFSLSF
ncbi:THO complex subunit 6 homolog isoform X1 [Acanthochromis polyacanthus]|uniref:THO complex subunit 6 homolog isoform X1 n=1 Tax=Acanthochromis polyacanthus TaxID=80966 RepID=UPI000B8F1A2C|nr:THO complex subunit 6 homolog isoform X1 [Acanthochromis polyacanthus]